MAPFAVREDSTLGGPQLVHADIGWRLYFLSRRHRRRRAQVVLATLFRVGPTPSSCKGFLPTDREVATDFIILRVTT